MQRIISNKIQQGFSKSARSYDRFTGLHREIADTLLAQVVRDSKPSVILDVGCGTGYLTGKLKEQFPQGKVFGLDFAEGMLEIARSKNKNITWILGDSNNLPLSEGIVDIVISNLAYQWVGSLLQAFIEARRVLVPDGILTCTIFGYSTCQELFQSLDQVKGDVLKFSRLPDEAQVREALDLSGFKSFKVDSENIKIEFSGMLELIRWLKSIGANNLLQEGYLGQEALLKAENIYRKEFSYLKGVGATFEVIRVYARK